MEEKSFPEVTGGGRYFFWKFWVSGLTFSCENGKSGGVGGVTTEIPSLVGVWIFLETHIPVRCRIILNLETFCKNRSLRGHELTGNECHTISNVCVVP